MKNLKLVFLLIAALSSFSVQAQEKEKSKPEKQYVVYERSRQITRLDIRRNAKATANVVEIETQSVTGGSATLLQGDVPTVEITSMEVVAGSYGRKNEVSRTGRAVKLQLLDVVYPLRLRLTIADRPLLELELKQPGTWIIGAGVTL